MYVIHTGVYPAILNKMVGERGALYKVLYVALFIKCESYEYNIRIIGILDGDFIEFRDFLLAIRAFSIPKTQDDNLACQVL